MSTMITLLKWFFCLAFAAMGLVFMLQGMGGPIEQPLMIGVVFLGMGVACYFFLSWMGRVFSFPDGLGPEPKSGVSSSSQTFDKAFFVAFKIQGPTGRLGRFRKVQAVMSDVEVQPSSKGSLIGFKCEAADPDTGATKTFVVEPTKFRVNGQPLNKRDARQWSGETVSVVYDSTDESDFIVDVLSLPRAGSQK